MTIDQCVELAFLYMDWAEEGRSRGEMSQADWAEQCRITVGAMRRDWEITTKIPDVVRAASKF